MWCQGAKHQKKQKLKFFSPPAWFKKKWEQRNNIKTEVWKKKTKPDTAVGVVPLMSLLWLLLWVVVVSEGEMEAVVSVYSIASCARVCVQEVHERSPSTYPRTWVWKHLHQCQRRFLSWGRGGSLTAAADLIHERSIRFTLNGRVMLVCWRLRWQLPLISIEHPAQWSCKRGVFLFFFFFNCKLKHASCCLIFCSRMPKNKGPGDVDFSVISCGGSGHPGLLFIMNNKDQTLLRFKWHRTQLIAGSVWPVARGLFV